MNRTGKIWAGSVLVALTATATSAWSQDRTAVCESIDNNRNSCPMLTDGHVRLVEQLSRAPCTKHQTWDVEDGGIWVSDGCRGRFETVLREGRRDDRYEQAPPPPPPQDDRYGNDQPPPQQDDRYNNDQPPPSSGASARLQARCARRVADYARINNDDAIPQGSRAVGDGVYEVDIGTPNGPMTCTIDRDGNVRGVMESR